MLGGPGRGKTTICQFIAQIYRANYLCAVKYEDAYSRKFMAEIEEKYKYVVQGMRVPLFPCPHQYLLLSVFFSLQPS